MFQRSGTEQVSWKDANITSAADLKGKKVGTWGSGNELELFAGMTKAGLDPATDVELVPQQFDVEALLNKEIDAAQAMTYEEYAQLLEAKDPATGKLYTPDDFNTINWNDEGTAMLQDSIWANTEKLKTDKAYCDTAVRFVAASLEGWAFCRDKPGDCDQRRAQQRFEAGQEPPGMAAERDQQADLAVAARRRGHDRAGPPGTGLPRSRSRPRSPTVPR